MIKAGIVGGSNPMAGELVRLLINHPDVEIMWVDSARYTGRLLCDVHHGLIGETSLRISPSPTFDDIDALFIFRKKGQTLEWLSQHPLPDDVRVIDLSVDMRLQENSSTYNFVYGLPELNRKSLVRGATRAVVPHPAANIIELALLPAVSNNCIESPVVANLLVPQLSEQVDENSQLVDEIACALRSLDSGFNWQFDVTATVSDDERVISAEVSFDSSIDVGEILRYYEEFYDDHNFTFLINEHPEAKEVAGTNKCLLHINKKDGRIVISAVMDALLKGAAGTAVHDMNLLFGLHERVGLALKASTF